VLQPIPSELLKDLLAEIDALPAVKIDQTVPGLAHHHTDFIWMGDEREGGGGFDLDRLLEGDLEPLSSLEQIALAIISAHTKDDLGRSDSERLEIAIAALTGRQREKGPELVDSEEVLDKIALEYFQRKVAPHTALTSPDKNGKYKHRKLSWSSCIAMHHPDWVGDRNASHSSSKGEEANAKLYRRVHRRLMEGLDERMARLTHGNDVVQQQRLQLRLRILRDLKALGVPVVQRLPPNS
jgi:hypothetical protein